MPKQPRSAGLKKTSTRNRDEPLFLRNISADYFIKIANVNIHLTIFVLAAMFLPAEVCRAARKNIYASPGAGSIVCTTRECYMQTVNLRFNCSQGKRHSKKIPVK